MISKTFFFLCFLCGICFAQPNSGTVEVYFDGGFETDRRDRGRPVRLIAAGLGVSPQVFRQAFSRVMPARGGHPTRERAHRNKQVLMEALSPHGVTNDRLDEVSNYYRYRPEQGEIWPIRPARALARIRNGKIVGFQIIEPGSGYISPPRVSVPGFEDVPLRVGLGFSRHLGQNGRITAINLAPSVGHN